jgi:dsRNA-specific ribonuclease
LDDDDAPKVLADLFESVAGAVYLDSGCSLIAAWNVFYKFFEPYFGILLHFQLQVETMR